MAVAETVAGDRRDAMRVAVSGAGGRAQAIDYIAWVKLHGSEINHDDVITADLKQLAMGSAGILEPVDGATTKLEPLVTTSPDATKIQVDRVAPLPDVAGLLTGFKSDNARYTLAARISGPVETAFPMARRARGGKPETAPNRRHAPARFPAPSRADQCRRRRRHRHAG
jgi:ABC-type uncharacterized transport system involved in gliding motility auxiliary subunit